MLSQILANELGPRLINTAIAAFMLFIICGISYFLFRKRCDGTRQRQKIKYRIGYIGILIFLLVMVRVWVEGFTHIFTMLSLIAAGIVVTNKENIMNIAGWLIINWRGVFSEGDYIQIQNLSGYVESVKMLGFKLLETKELGDGIATGKTIKVPNGLIITNPIFIFPSEKTLMLQKIEWQVDMINDGLKVAYNVENAIKRIIHEKYATDPSYSIKAVKKNNKMLSTLIDLDPHVDIRLIPDKQDKMMLVISFYCYPKDRALIEKDLVMLKLTPLAAQIQSEPLLDVSE